MSNVTFDNEVMGCPVSLTPSGGVFLAVVYHVDFTARGEGHTQEEALRDAREKLAVMLGRPAVRLPVQPGDTFTITPLTDIAVADAQKEAFLAGAPLDGEDSALDPEATVDGDE